MIIRVVKNFLQGHDTPEGRGKKRVRKAALTGVATLAVRGVTIGAGLISIPLTARYLGTERFGLWLTLSSLLSWISIADLGLANSLTNALATADGKQNQQQAREAVSSAFWLMMGVMGIVILVFTLAYPLVPWEKVFNVTSEQAKVEAGLAVLAGFIFFALRLPLSIPSRIYGAYQEGYFYQIWSGIGSLLSIVALLIAINFKAGLPQLVGAFFGTSLLADLLAAVHIFGWQRRWLKPNIQNFNWITSKWLLKTGAQFWIVQISAIAFLQTDLIIVAQLFGASAVASYGVLLKLFSIIGIVQTAFLAPFWPAYCEALAKKDTNWIFQTFKKSIFLSLLWSCPMGILLLYLAPKIIQVWIGSESVPKESLIIAMLFTVIISAIAQCIGTLLTGMNQIMIQVICASLAATFNIVIAISLAKLIGLPGVAIATGITLFIFSILIGGLYIKIKIKNFVTT
ncbi:MATE family efflux transporter [Synechocystis sp. PCC 7509]|uniref:MATE family efflux transporter n=1 Tax=Synechocystis sp. PCC 7509 TaxID=927677 RepID=UPI0002ACD48E|nr:MATE family efflux transporter [Synechocystis sp. PCC 7509]